jgi:aromatic ring-cleaving dioxygenase
MPGPHDINGYHAHVYFDANSEPAALDLRERIAESLDVDIGRIHRKPVGPHPHWSYQLAFAPDQFGEVVPFLMLHRGRLDVLVHPRTGDEIRDHFDYAIWLGEKAALRREPLLRSKD